MTTKKKENWFCCLIVVIIGLHYVQWSVKWVSTMKLTQKIKESLDCLIQIDVNIVFDCVII